MNIDRQDVQDKNKNLISFCLLMFTQPMWWVENVSRLQWGNDLEEAWLSPEETARAARCHFDTDRGRWRRGRAWVRRRLAQVLNCAPVDISLKVDDRGRPHVIGAPAGFDANWSHSGDWIALAVHD